MKAGTREPRADVSQARKSLHSLILELFTTEEFRRWVRFGPYSAIECELPERGSPPADVVGRALDALERRGYVNATFFRQLKEDRPKKAARIREVASLWTIVVGVLRSRPEPTQEFHMAPVKGRLWKRFALLCITVLAVLAVFVGGPYIAALVILSGESNDPGMPNLDEVARQDSTEDKDENIGLRIADADWRGPYNVCSFSSHGRVATANIRSLPGDDLIGLTGFNNDSYAVFSFDLQASRRVKISSIEIVAKGVDAAPPIACTAMMPFEEANLYLVDLRPTGQHMSFEALLVGHDTPGHIWLEPERYESFYLLLNAQRTSVFEVSSVVITYQEGGRSRQVSMDLKRTIGFH